MLPHLSSELKLCTFVVGTYVKEQEMKNSHQLCIVFGILKVLVGTESEEECML